MSTLKTTITPEKASELLSKNINNRPLNKKRIQSYAADMKNGRWAYNGATIVINDEQLLDGQHRLHACVLACVPFVTNVTDDVETSAMITIDNLKPRNSSDALSFLKESNHQILGSAVSLVENYMTDTIRHNKKLSNAMVVEVLNKYPGIRDSVDFITGLSKRPVGSKPMMAAFHYLCSMKDKELADKFFKDFAKGVGLISDEPVFMLRERLIQNSMNKAKLSRLEVMALIIKAWNLTRDGKTGGVLKWRKNGPYPEAFPKIK